MSALRHTLVLLASVLAAWLWLGATKLEPYALQAFGLSILAYFVFKRLNRSQIWHLGPSFMSLDMAFLTFGFLLLIGSTGNTSSPFFLLSFVHLFLLIFSAQMSTSIVLTLAVVLFHYTLMSSFSTSAISPLLSLPLMTGFFLFTKQQYLQAYREQELLNSEDLSLQACQLDASQMHGFLATSLRPRLAQLQKLLAFPQQNQQAMVNHVTQLQIETEQLMASPVPTPNFEMADTAPTSVPTSTSEIT